MDILKNVRVTDTAYGGYGVARDKNGKVIFIPYTVEGDIVDCEITESKHSLSYANLLSISSPSDKRLATPICRYYNRCGGCLFAHIKYDDQLEIKKNILRNSFRKFDNIDDFDIIPSTATNYRLRTYIQLRDGKLGYYKFKSRDFVKVKSCNILKQSLFDKLAFFAEKNINLTGEIYAIETDSEIALASVILDKERDKLASRYPLFDLANFDGIEIGSKRYGIDKTYYNTLYGAVPLSHRTFFQSNHYLLDQFQSYSVELVRHGFSVLELYAGSGFFTVGLQQTADDIIAVEDNITAVNLAASSNLKIIKSDVVKYLQKLKNIDTIFLDPPREGLGKLTIAEILRLKPIEIIYISCDPITLARDISILYDHYKIDSIKLFDLYPDTYHIESVVKLIRK